MRLRLRLATGAGRAFRFSRCRWRPSMRSSAICCATLAGRRGFTGGATTRPPPRASPPRRPTPRPAPVPPAEARAERPYAADAVVRFFHALVAVDRVFKLFRTGFLGKVSPVHLFWGSFDLAVTRFSGPRAPLHPGGIPALSDEVAREAYSHEVSSAGFLPGGA